MPSIKELVQRLRADYPHITLAEEDVFRWSASTNTLTFVSGDNATLYLLHELAHVLLHHHDYRLDIELLRQEMQAWQYAETELALKYGVPFDSLLSEEALETYREWLHARTHCPECHQTGLQTNTHTYTCLNCRCVWRSNEARTCGLRRFVI
jgi:hypothetical protein